MTAITRATGSSPVGETTWISERVSIRKLYKDLYLGTRGQNHELALGLHHGLIFTDAPYSIAFMSEWVEQCRREKLALGQDFLPPGCRLIISGKNPTMTYCYEYVLLQCTSGWKVGISCNVQEFTQKTGKSAAELVAMI